MITLPIAIGDWIFLDTAASLKTLQEGVFAVDDDDGDEDGEDEDLPRWTDLETMNSCHPLYFARMIAEVSDSEF